MNSGTQNQNSVPFPADCTLYNDMSGKPNQFSSLAYTVVIFTIIINATTLPFTILLNLLVMAAVATKGRLQRKSNIALACLATADFMVGIIGQPLKIAVTITTLQGKTTSQACSVQTAAKLSHNFFHLFFPYSPCFDECRSVRENNPSIQVHVYRHQISLASRFFHRMDLVFNFALVFIVL